MRIYRVGRFVYFPIEYMPLVASLREFSSGPVASGTDHSSAFVECASEKKAKQFARRVGVLLLIAPEI